MRSPATSTRPTRSTSAVELRRRARTQLRNEATARTLAVEIPKSAVDIRRLCHELQVHQVELELQNTELQRSRDSLETALEDYTDLYEFSPVGYFSLSADGVIHRVNLTGSTLVGIERSGLLGKPFQRLVSVPLRPAFNSFLKRVFETESRQSGEFEISIPGRPARSVNIEAQRLENQLECRAVLVDTTDRKAGEDRVRVSEIRYRRLFEAAQDGILIVDPETCRITDANSFMTTLLGHTRDELVGRELFEIGLLKDAVSGREIFEKLKSGHGIRYEGLPMKRRGGGQQEVEVVANLYRENGHSVIQFNLRDITARKQAEELFRRHEGLFAALVMQAPFGVYVVDDRLRLLQANPRALSVFENVHPVIGRDLLEILNVLWPKRVSARIVNLFKGTLKTGEPYQASEFSERRLDTGAKEISEWQIQRITLPDGRFGVVARFNEITGRKLAEEAMRRLAVVTASNEKREREIVRRRLAEKALRKHKEQQGRMLLKSNQMREQLQGLAHKILQAQEAERKRISRELHDVITQTVVGIGVHLNGLSRRGLVNARFLKPTQQLIEQSVVTLHQFARELRPTLLDDLGLIPALQSYLEEFTKKTGVHVRLAVFAGVEQLPITHRTVLYRVAQEAFQNVAQHARAGRVQVNIQNLDGQVQMTIRDDGISFDVESKVGGRLGLLGIRERLEMVGGDLTIESEGGKGTTILARVPFPKKRAGRPSPR